jgi:hypothetical protein
MLISSYDDKYRDDIIELVKAFHQEALKEYCSIDINSLIQAIQTYRDNAFLLIVDDKCVGILAGIITKSPINSLPVFQEVIWYVQLGHRLKGVMLFKEAQKRLKAQGVASMVMVCLGNSKHDKLVNFYERDGFVLLEQHFIKQL